MPERMDAAQLELVLTRMASSVEYPATPDIDAAVAVRLESASAPPASVAVPRWGMRPAYAAAAVLVALGLFFSFSSGARRAVADWLGVSGIRIETEYRAPTVTSDPTELDLGERVGLSEAVARASFDIKMPALAPFDEPDYVYVEEVGGVVRVSFVYEPGDGIPPSDVTGTGAILSQFEAELMLESIKKVNTLGTRLRPTEINGRPAFWIAGEPHEVGDIDDDGRFLPEEPRLAGNVLLWELGDTTFRLESELTFTRALEVARSIR